MNKNDFGVFNDFVRGTFHKEGKSAEDILHACAAMLPSSSGSSEKPVEVGITCNRCRGKGFIYGGYQTDDGFEETGAETCPQCGGNRPAIGKVPAES